MSVVTSLSYLAFVIVGFAISYFSRVQAQREHERYIQMRVSAMLREVEEVKASCKRIDMLLADY